MKKTLIILLIIVLSNSCKAQNKSSDTFEKVNDSISLSYREKADLILKQFDDIIFPKILYSLDNKDFYVIIKKDSCILEYYISINKNDKINKKRILKTENKDKEYLLKVFDFNNYHKEFITKSKDAKYVRGKLSYFVLMDAYNRRFGEYCLSSFTLPIPIDGKLFAYLIKHLSNEIVKDK